MSCPNGLSKHNGSLTSRVFNFKIKTVERILVELKACKTFYDFLVYIRDTEGLELVQDNGWYWLEYNGVEIEGTGKERFTSSSQMNDLLRLAGL
jgi:hypothetical protein